MTIKVYEDKNTISISGSVGDYEGMISASDFAEALAGVSGDVTVEINSPGGVVTEGLAIYNMLCDHDGETTVVVNGLCASIATVIACAADKVVMYDKSKFMIHRAWTVAMGNCKDFRSMAEIMEMMDEEIADVYQEKTSQSRDTIMIKMDKETWMSAKQAKEFGFVDEILKPTRGKDKPEAMASATEKPVAIMGLSPQMRALAEVAKQRCKIANDVSLQ